MKYILAGFIGYLFGNIATAYIAGRLLKGIDIRNHGSGNAGATNVFRVLGKVPGIIVFGCDILKGAAAALIGSMITGGQPLGAIIGGVFAVVGHNWPVVLGFKGGKGIATSMGLLIVTVPDITAILVVVGAILVTITGYVSLGSIAAAILYPILIFLFDKPLEIKLFGFLLSIFALYKHRSNFVRLIKGQENKISFRR